MTTATEVAIAAARVRAYEAALPFAEEDDRREQRPARPIAVEEAESDLARALRDLICRAETRLAELGEGS